MTTRVIHIRNAPPAWQWNEDYVYIGRPSKWGNPFVLRGDDERGDTILRYKHWLSAPEQDALRAQIDELRGKTLVCFCKPAPCHGDVLVAIIEARDVFDG